ncbi:bacteriocin immunity protein [Pseudomonas sp. NPDC099000]|uniref:bacteriocin immunity protein n=1 Tax=Pseudomonas sp. NPDC099000 TaxID=3364488 RepID=UPI00383A0D18
MIFKKRLEDYTETEFLAFLGEFFHQTSDLRGQALEDYRDDLLDHFELISEHPDRSDVIFYPKEGQEDSPEGILKEVKEWRALNNKPGFKPE